MIACRSGEGSRQQKKHAAAALEGRDRTSEGRTAAAALEDSTAYRSWEGQRQKKHAAVALEDPTA